MHKAQNKTEKAKQIFKVNEKIKLSDFESFLPQYCAPKIAAVPTAPPIKRF